MQQRDIANIRLQKNEDYMRKFLRNLTEEVFKKLN